MVFISENHYLDFKISVLEFKFQVLHFFFSPPVCMFGLDVNFNNWH